MKKLYKRRAIKLHQLNLCSWLVKATKKGLKFNYGNELRGFKTCPNFDDEIQGYIKVFFTGYWGYQDFPINGSKS